MSDAPPPLPDDDDPLALLGVAEGADERELKRAYARRIKVYRPDRSPAEFARIHAAFELLRFVRTAQAASVAAPAPAPAAEARAAEVAEGGTVATARAAEVAEGGTVVEGRAAEVAEGGTVVEARAAEARAAAVAEGRAAALEALVAAVAVGDHDAALAEWERVRRGGAPLDEVVVDAPPATQRWILEHAPLTWRELARGRAGQGAFHIWQAAFAARVVDPRRRAAAIAMAEEPALVADASHDPGAAILALQAASCLAWRDLAAARRVLGALRAVVRHPLVERLHDRATLDVDVVGRDYHGHNRPPLPPHVLELLADWAVLRQDERATLVAALRTALCERPEEYLAHLTGTARRYPELAEALAHRLLDGVPAHRRDVTVLPAGLRGRLARELEAIRPGVPWLLSLGLLVLGVALAVVLAVKAAAYFPDVEDAAGYGFMVGGGGGGLAVIAIERWQYRRRVRGLLAGVLARVGVTRAAAREWLANRPWHELRLRRFAYSMSRDEALRLVGMLAGNVADDRALEAEGD